MMSLSHVWGLAVAVSVGVHLAVFSSLDAPRVPMDEAMAGGSVAVIDDPARRF